MKIILASASPRRKELLERMDVTFEVLPARGEEVITKDEPQEVVKELALQKAREVMDGVRRENREQELLVLGADTIVVFEGQILGKPMDEEDAKRMLSMLSGNTHSVYTGVAILYFQGEREQIYNFSQESKVRMYPISREEISDYVASKEPMDKAGSYGIQGKGALYIEGIAGDYNNVMGLPIARIYQELKRAGIMESLGLERTGGKKDE